MPGSLRTTLLQLRLVRCRHRHHALVQLGVEGDALGAGGWATPEAVQDP